MLFASVLISTIPNYNNEVYASTVTPDTGDQLVEKPTVTPDTGDQLIEKHDFKAYDSDYTPEIYFSYEPSSTDSVIITGYTGTDTDVKIPPTLYGENVVEIGGHSFEDNTDITSVSIPNGVTEIGNDAFQKCTNLKTVELPESLEVINKGSFCDCTSLEAINLPSSLKRICEAAFDGCKSLTSIVIPNLQQKLFIAMFQQVGGY